jgi:DNA-binding NarL/FixJ family response regulator
MAHSSCLAGIDPSEASLLDAMLEGAGVSETAIRAPLEVADLGRLEPDILVCDIDGVRVAGLELLRRLRFVLPECLIAVYSGNRRRSWGRDCHLAGANCLLSKSSNRSELAHGMRDAMRTGCFTDPFFVA